MCIRDSINIDINYMHNNRVNEEISNKIQTLKYAPNFITTHKLVSDLNARKANFAPRHFGEAMDACLANNQVYWIGKDEDVLEFFQFLTKNCIYNFTEEEKTIIKDYFLS